MEYTHILYLNNDKLRLEGYGIGLGLGLGLGKCFDNEIHRYTI